FVAIPPPPAPPAPVAASARLTAQYLGHGTTKLLGLVIRDLAAGDTLTLRCSGHGCKPAMKRTQAVKRTTSSLSLTRYIRGARLKGGAKLQAEIAHANQIARVFIFTMRSSGDGVPRLQRRCVPPGGKLTAC